MADESMGTVSSPLLFCSKVEAHLESFQNLGLVDIAEKPMGIFASCLIEV
jgi:hypothetical protein